MHSVFFEDCAQLLWRPNYWDTFDRATSRPAPVIQDRDDSSSGTVSMEKL
jgi:hypothetical protein